MMRFNHRPLAMNNDVALNRWNRPTQKPNHRELKWKATQRQREREKVTLIHWRYSIPTLPPASSKKAGAYFVYINKWIKRRKKIERPRLSLSLSLWLFFLSSICTHKEKKRKKSKRVVVVGCAPREWITSRRRREGRERKKKNEALHKTRKKWGTHIIIIIFFFFLLLLPPTTNKKKKITKIR